MGMRVVTFRGEESVAAIADKVYGDLSHGSRESAEAALLRANPRLEHLEDLKAGTVLRIPDVAGVSRRPGGDLEDPVGQLRDMLIGELDAYAAQLAQRHEAHQRDLEGQMALLKSRPVKKVLDSSPPLRGLPQELRARSKAAATSLDAFQAALERLKADLTKH